MKFGRNLPRNQVPEWSAFYIDYKGLKKLIKTAADAAKTGEKVDLAEFFFALDRNHEDVDTFYNKKFSEAHRRLKLLQDKYGRTPDLLADLDEHEVEELMGAILELRNQLRNLQWFGEINRRGFVKITKKLDKKVPNTTTQHRYITTKVDPSPFAKDVTLVRLVGEINKWLSVLGDQQNVDDAMSDVSARSVRSLGRVTARASLNVPQTVLDKLENAMRQDDVATLQSSLTAAGLITVEQPSQEFLLSLLQRSISWRAKACIAFLLLQIRSLDEVDDLNERNCIHRLVIHIGRSKSIPTKEDEPHAASAASAASLPVSSHYNNHYVAPISQLNGDGLAVPKEAAAELSSSLLNKDDETVQILSHLLESLQPDQRGALSCKDSLGRIPLHYAAQYGFVVVCQILMAYMQKWDQFNVEHGIDAFEWQDKEGNAPLHLAVIAGHPLTTQCLLKGEDWQGLSDTKTSDRKAITKSSIVLVMATKSNYTSIVRSLVDAGVGINWQNEFGETALHIAARFGHDECARILIQGSEDQKADLELTEKTFAFTPLHIAAVDGHFSTAKILTEAGADATKADQFGWTAKEHAALRGHMQLAFYLEPLTPSTETVENGTEDTESTNSGSPPKEVASLEDRKSDGSSKPTNTDPVKSFGHRYLKDQSLVLISLGSMDLRKNMNAVKLEHVPLAEAHTNQLDTALSIVVSAKGATGEPSIIDLPAHDNISTEPVVFTTNDETKVTIMFDLVPTYSGNEKNKIGRAVALLSSIRPTIGAKRMNLQGDVQVPIIGANLDVIGVVNFNFLVVTPFSHPKMEVNEQQTYWKKMSSTMVFGHRGLGKNLMGNKSLQLGENTVPSFIAAANLGANYVEFDVQITKDHVPVIYHDFLVSETGIDAPVHTLTLEQFMHINPDAKTKMQRDVAAQKARNGRVNGTSEPNGRQRSHSVDFAGDSKETLDEKMKYTRDWKEKAYKGNTRGNVVQAPFATLEDLFNQIPEEVGFNIELKYPMLLESEEHDMDTYAIELNSFCDTILAKVYDLTATRQVLFSSFNPDICLCLSYKQPSIPIMFLTDSGNSEVSDVRASSLQEAVRFASRWNLLGIVSEAATFVNSPRLVRVVKQSGLVCVSYGKQNNDPACVQRQVKEGIDAVIVDNVLAIRQGLTNSGGAPAKVVAA